MVCLRVLCTVCMFYDSLYVEYLKKKNLRQIYDKHATTAVGSFSSSIMGNCPPFIFKIGF